jgi:thiol:disulfide interchange protein DsbD
MKKTLFLLLCLCTSLGFSQIFNPVTWETKTEKISDTEYKLISIAKVEKGWHLYAQEIPEFGPVATAFTYDNDASDFTLNGKTIEEKGISIFDPVFEMQITYFEGEVQFEQAITVTKNITKVTGSVLFMACDDEKCTPPTDAPLIFNLKQLPQTNGAENSKKKTLIDNTEAHKILYGITPENISLIDNDLQKTKSLWVIFGLGFVGGLLALLTPCVFPMIPLTVSFFTKRNTSSKKSGVGKAILYGFFILFVYLLLSIPFHLLDSVNPDILNEISTNVWLNVIFFIVFIFFAFSFFGYYELTLPASWTTKTTQGENAGGLIGIFFMALTLAIVSFSCTGPILGSLLAGSLTADGGGAWQLTAGMAGFGVALGLPFALFAMFPNMLNALPKSGGWLNTTKVVLGFLELALAFKFLSNADLVAHWNILKIEPFLILWIVIFSGLALYLFGKLKFPHDGPIKKLSFLRLSFGVLTGLFVLYLTSGFRINKETKTFTSLTLLSGLAPPVSYSFFLPSSKTNNLKTFKDLKQGISYAKQVNKPIMIDFTGYACVNCRKMEEHVWSKKEIANYLKNDFVIISLYVDDKKALPKQEQLEVSRSNGIGGNRLLKNYGHKWAHFQTHFFGSNSQPYYVLLSSDGTKMLNKPAGYTPNVNDYANFLKSGLEAAKQ